MMTTRRVDMDDIPSAGWSVKLLKWLVIGLTASMIALAGVLIWAIASEMRGTRATFPDSLALPEGTRPAAVTQARDFTVVVTDTGEILLFDADGALIRQIEIE